MLDPKGKADSLTMTIVVSLGGWRQWPGDTFQWLRTWNLPGYVSNAAWVREDGKGAYEWCAFMPANSRSGWRRAETGEEGRDKADEWLISHSKKE